MGFMSQSTPCPNCHASHASHYVGDEDFRCALCNTECKESVARQTTLANLLTARFREIQELISVYKDLIQLRSPIRTMLLSRMKGCLEDIASMESMDSSAIPEANLDLYEMDTEEYDEDDEDERRRRAKS